MEKREIVLFETDDKEVRLSVPIEDDTVWLNRGQMSELADFYNLDVIISVGYRVP